MYLKDQRDAVLSTLYLLYCQVTLHVSGVSHAHHHGRVAARPWTLFKRILSLHLQINDLYQWM